MVRGVTRLDGARGKNKFGTSVVELAPPWSKFGTPMVEPEFFRKQIYCIEVLVILLELFGAPAVIQRPHSELAPGELCPPCPPRYAPGYG